MVVGFAEFQKACVSPSTEGFGMVFRYGVGAKSELDTFKGTYTRDMVIDPPITVSLSLSKEELARICQEMVRIGFFDYPREFPPNPERSVIPCVKYYMRVEYGSKIKDITWDQNSLLKGNIEIGLGELVGLITNIIESKEEYRGLPTPRGAYL